MSEGIGDKAPPLSRRKALGLIAGSVALGGAILTKEAQQALRPPEAGLETTVGLFYPVNDPSEESPFGVKLRGDKEGPRLPEDINAFFADFKIGGLGYNTSPNSLIEQAFNSRSLPPRLLDRLVSSGTNLVFTYPYLVGEMEELLGFAKKRAVGVAVLAGLGLSYQRIMVGVGSILKREPPLISRRKFLKYTFLGLAGVAAAPVVVPFGLLADPKMESALGRVYARIAGLISQTAPDNHLVFLNNAIMANKLLTVAQTLNEKQGRKPKVAFITAGAGMTGIEDFLLLGNDFARWVIVQYPDDLLRGVIKEAGNIENFCSSRIVSLPEELKGLQGTLDLSGNHVILSAETKEGKDITEVPVSEIVTTDQKLVGELEAKLGKDRIGNKRVV